jgi:hypothetical protein
MMTYEQSITSNSTIEVCQWLQNIWRTQTGGQ